MNIAVLGPTQEIRTAIVSALRVEDRARIQEVENPLTIFPADGQVDPIVKDLSEVADIIAMPHRLFQDINGQQAVSALRAMQSKVAILTLVLNHEREIPRLAMYAFIPYPGEYRQFALNRSVTIADLRDVLNGIIT